MHELFLTTNVGNGDDLKAARVLQGYCAMSPIPVLRRRLLWRGPSSRNAYKSIDPAFLLSIKPQQRHDLWRSLNEQFTRQAYVVTLLYDIKKDQFQKDGGEVESEARPPIVCDELPGTLQWTDLPDPGLRPVNSRTLMNIDGERGLCSILYSINYRFTVELIEEGYRFAHGNVVIYLTRFLIIPLSAQEWESDGKPKVNGRLPTYETLTPFDEENKWILIVKVELLNGNDQELVKKGTEELLGVKADLEGLFDLQVKDRLIFDTRVRS